MPKNAMPNTKNTIGRKYGDSAASRGPSPDDRVEGHMDIPGPARFQGTFSEQAPPVRGSIRGPRILHIPQKPINTQKGSSSKLT